MVLSSIRNRPQSPGKILSPDGGGQENAPGIPAALVGVRQSNHQPDEHRPYDGLNVRMKPEPSSHGATTGPAWRRYLRFGGARVDENVDNELRFHLDMRTRDFRRLGLSDKDARIAAGGRRDVSAVRSRCLTIASRRERRLARSLTIEAVGQDFRFTMRQLRRNIGWATVATLTIAMGIGATTQCSANSLILHPHAVPRRSRGPACPLGPIPLRSARHS